MACGREESDGEGVREFLLSCRRLLLEVATGGRRLNKVCQAVSNCSCSSIVHVCLCVSTHEVDKGSVSHSTSSAGIEMPPLSACNPAS